jgi:hypothetical protein
MEEEARDVLRIALANDEPAAADILELVRRRFRKLRPIELRIPEREPMREPPDFGR